MNASKDRRVRKKEKEREMTMREELLEVKTKIAGMQEQLEDTIEGKEKLRYLNYQLLDDLRLERESKIPFTQCFKVSEITNQVASLHFRGHTFSTSPCLSFVPIFDGKMRQ